MLKNDHLRKLARKVARSGRSKHGSMIVLIGAVTVGIVIGLIFFCLNYSRLIGSNAEQKKAIEAAALAAANDCSNIVINTKEMGYVSLSDQAPIGTATAAGDQFCLPVRGINTILGTARIDAIISDQIEKIDSSTVMSQLALNDLADAKKVITQLETALTQACAAAGPKPTDRDGKPIDVYADAQNAYVQNCIRMSGSSNYVAGSLVITMGELVNPSETNICVPQPAGTFPVSPLLQQNGNYKSFVNVPYTSSLGNMDFVFGGIGDSTRLVDVRDWIVSAAGLPYHVPTIVKVEADQIIRTSQTPNGATFHSAACAQPGSVFDVKPAPGAITIEFPDGSIPGLSKPADLLTSAFLNAGADADTESAVLDYPTNPGSSLDSSCPAYPPGVAGQKIGDGWRIALFDWIRRGGTKVDAARLVAMQTTVFKPAVPAMIDWVTELSNSPLVNTDLTKLVSGPQIPFGVMHLYKFDSSGAVMYKSQPVSPYPYQVVADQQLYLEKLSSAGKPGDFISSLPPLVFNNVTLPGMGNGGGGKGGGKPGKKGGGKSIPAGTITLTPEFDVYVRDQCRLLGTISGGKHGGEPLNDTLVVMGPPANDSRIALNQDYGAGGLGAGQPSPPKGGGANPLLTAQVDFGDNIAPPEPTLTYSQNGGSPTVRPTYQTTGLAGSIRFRRVVQVDANILNVLTGILMPKSDKGYIGAKTGSTLGVITYSTPIADTTTVTDDLLNK
jgi:hypothetical protein